MPASGYESSETVPFREYAKWRRRAEEAESKYDVLRLAAKELLKTVTSSPSKKCDDALESMRTLLGFKSHKI